MQDAVLASVVRAPAHGYELHQRLLHALGPSGEALNPGQVYVTLSRLEQAGLVRVCSTAQPGPRRRTLESVEREREAVKGSIPTGHSLEARTHTGATAVPYAGSSPVRSPAGGASSRRGKKVYEATRAGRARVAVWLEDRSWSRVAPVEFHLKLVAAVSTGMADPVVLVHGQRRELLRRLSEVERVTAQSDPSDAHGGLLLSGASLRLQADIRWLDLCEQRWTKAGHR